jgi:hypothetical protein
VTTDTQILTIAISTARTMRSELQRVEEVIDARPKHVER